MSTVQARSAPNIKSIVDDIFSSPQEVRRGTTIGNDLIKEVALHTNLIISWNVGIWG